MIPAVSSVGFGALRQGSAARPSISADGGATLLLGLQPSRIGCMCNGQHLADAAVPFAAAAACSRDTQPAEGTTLTARAACGCGQSPTSSPLSLGRAVIPIHTSVFCHTAISLRVVSYIAQFLSKIN